MTIIELLLLFVKLDKAAIKFFLLLLFFLIAFATLDIVISLALFILLLFLRFFIFSFFCLCFELESKLSLLILEAFLNFDKNRSGTISKEELLSTLKSENKNNPNLEKEVEKLIKDVDKNGDGKIDYNEFLALMQK